MSGAKEARALLVRDLQLAFRRLGQTLLPLFFLLMLFLAVAVIFVYSQAPAIARALPESEPTLIAFVDWANGLRDQIDVLIGK